MPMTREYLQRTRDEDLRELAVQIAQNHLEGYDPQAPMAARAAVIDPLVDHLLGGPGEGGPDQRERRKHAVERVVHDLRLIPRAQRHRQPVGDFLTRCREMEGYLNGH